jgi:hypothetical protein
MNPHYTAISERANHRCEYCHAPELVFNFPFEVEHIIPLSQQGSDEEINLALACRSCNLCKGSRISGIVDPNANTKASFFHPRKDQWENHFQFDPASGMIIGITPIGKVTVENLQMNRTTQLDARKLWIRLDLFP